MQEVGKIVKINKDTAFVRIDRKKECASCGMCGFKKQEQYVDLKVKNTMDATIGDLVEIKTEKDNALKSALIVYIMPLIFATIGLIIGNILKNEIIMIILSLTFLVLGYIIVIIIDRKMKKNDKYTPVMIKLIKS